jgi:methyl-accepting chemotaxis protein
MFGTHQNSLRRTILLFLVLFVIALCSLTFISTYIEQQSNLRAEFLARGKALAKNLAYNSRPILLAGDARPLYALIDSLLKEPDIRWAAIEGTDGKLLAQNSVPDVRLEKGELDSTESHEAVRINPIHLPKHETVLDLQVDIQVQSQAAAETHAPTELELLGGSLPSSAAAPATVEGRWLGTVHIGLSLQGLETKLARSRRHMLEIFLGALLLSILVGWIFSNSFLRPIDRLVFLMEAIASSKGDLTQRIHLDRRDELGRLAEAFNRFVTSIHQIMLETSQLIHDMNVSLEQISMTTEEVNNSSNHINDNVQAFTHDLEQQEEMTTQTTSRIRQVAETLLDITLKAESATRVFEETEEVSRQGRATVQTSMEKITLISESMQSIERRMQTLTTSLNQIGAFVTAIQKIANQTNMLSLNAAIEAARAGETGKGFSVVAEEVRRLAENAALSSRNIQDVIQKIQKETRLTSEATHQSSIFVQASSETIVQAGGSLEQILEKADQASTVSVEVSRSMRDQTEQLKTMLDSVLNVQQLGRNNFSTAQRTAGAVKDQAQNMQQIALAIQHLGESAQRVRQRIVEFKLE